MNLNNYILLDETYVHDHSKTIDTIHNKISKFRLLYDGWIEFTKVHRSNGKIEDANFKSSNFFILI